MIKKLLILILVLIVASLSAENIFTVIEMNDGYIKVKFEVPDYVISDTEINNEIYHIICYWFLPIWHIFPSFMLVNN